MHRERMINRRQQGDLGEASAIEWLTRQGATVFIPFGHSPDVDLVAEIGEQLLRVQVKTTTQRVATTDGHVRFPVMIATNGGNQSWSGVAKRFDASRFDHLFALTGEGRRWFIPSNAIDCQNSITLGGPKYAEFEIDSGGAILGLVYGEDTSLESSGSGGVPKRSNGFGCKPNGIVPSQVRILPPPFEPPAYERTDGRSGQAVIWTKRRMTIPLRPFQEAGLAIGDRVRARSDGPGRIILEKTGLPVWAEPL